MKKILIMLIIVLSFLGCKNVEKPVEIDIPKYTNYEECKDFCYKIKARSMCYFGCKDLYPDQTEDYYNTHGKY